MKAFIFDFDGPIFDGRKAAQEALSKTFDQFNSRLGTPEINFSQLPLFDPVTMVAAVYASKKLTPDMLGEIEQFYRKELKEAEASLGINDEMDKLLSEMHNRGYKLAILSSRKEKNIISRLRELGASEYFQDQNIYGRDSVSESKPHPEALFKISKNFGMETGDMVVIGDTDMDYECAANAKAIYYHIAWSGEPACQAIHKADKVLNSIADLREILLLSLSSRRQNMAVSPPKFLEEAIEQNDISFFAGSGVSVPSGIGDWDKHYRRVLQRFGAGYLLDEDFDMPEIVQLLAAEKSDGRKLFEEFKESFDKPHIRPNPYHYAMLRSGVSRIWTTNYDNLFERANEISGFGYNTVNDDQMLLQNFRKPGLIVKMNSDFFKAVYEENLDWHMVFTQEQFDLIEQRRPEIWRLFEDDYRNKCIIFVGVSFRDPALRRIVAVARQKIRGTRYNHYLLMKRATDLAKQKIQDLQADNLQRQYIETIFVNEFNQIMRFVSEIAIKSIKPIIGFSGSLRTSSEGGKVSEELVGGDMTFEDIEKFSSILAEQLARRGYRITSGCAPGVGIPAVNAAFKVNPLGTRFYLRQGGGTKYKGTAPAIVVPDDRDKGEDKYASIRERFISEITILIALGGRNEENRESGVIKEIKLATQKQIPVIIVPQAGGAAKEYWKHYLDRIDGAYPDTELAKRIKETNKVIEKQTPSQLLGSARHEFLDHIHKLMVTMVGSSLHAKIADQGAIGW